MKCTTKGVELNIIAVLSVKDNKCTSQHVKDIQSPCSALTQSKMFTTEYPDTWHIFPGTVVIIFIIIKYMF